jgi:hypothetical protein
MKPAVWTGMRITLLAGLLLIAAACQRTPPEEALRARMSVLESAIDARDAGALGDFLADDFIGPGGMDGTGARRLAQGLFLRYRDIGTRLGPLDVQVQEQHATVRFDAIVTGGAGSLLPDSGQVYDVRTAWRLEGGEWVLVSAEWAPGMAGQ